MHGEDSLLQISSGARKTWREFEDWLVRLDAYGSAQAVPQSLQAHFTMVYLARFHSSMLALRLLAQAGFRREAISVLCQMARYAAATRIFSGSPDIAGNETAATEQEGCSRSYDAAIQAAARPDWYAAFGQMEDSLLLPEEPEGTEELIPAAGPAPFDPSELLGQACRLAAMMLEPAAFEDAEDREYD